MLDNVDLKLDWYTPSVDAFRFISFIRLCIGEEPENLNSKAHYFFIDCLFGSECVKPYFTVRGMDFDFLKDNVLILSTREFSKSVLVTYLILYMAVEGKKPGFGKVKFGLYVSDKMEGNVKTTMNTIESLYLGSEYLQSIFEETHFTDKRCEFYRKPRTKAELAVYKNHIATGGTYKTVPMRSRRKFMIKGLGCSGGRGERSDLDRPDFAIHDDMIANEIDATSEKVLASIESTIEADVGGSLNTNGHFKIFIGTAYNTLDPIYRRAEDGTVLPVVFPKAEVFPHDDIYDKKGTLVKKAITEEEFVSVWPDRHSYEKQKLAYRKAEIAATIGATTKLKKINQEFYCRVTSSFEQLIPKSDLKFIDMKDVKKNAKLYNWYITTDFTTSGNVDSDDSSIMLWALDWNNNYFLVNLSVGKKVKYQQYQVVLNFIEEAKRYGASWVEVGVEIDGNQKSHVWGLEEYGYKRGINIEFVKQRGVSKQTSDGIRSRGFGDKLTRLKFFQPNFEDGKVFFNKIHEQFNTSMSILLRELNMTTYFEIKSTDNGLDTISMLGSIDSYFPSKPATDSISSDDEDTLGYNGLGFTSNISIDSVNSTSCNYT
jgi:phage terminase large subunit-like protein